MKRRLLLLLLLFPWHVLAQTDPLNVAYKPSVNTSCPNNAANGTAHNVWITDWSQKIVQGNSTAGTNCFQQIYATQGEFGDFQVHVVAPTGGYAGVTVTSSSFVCSTGPTCSSAPFTIPAPSTSSTNIVVHREAYHNITTVTNHSASYYNVTGVYPDALIPAIDPYFHQTTNAFPVAVAASKTQSAWIDVYVPNNAPSGYYLGTITVSDGVAGTLAQIPVILAVWQWPTAQGGHMPATSSLRSDTQSGFHDFCAFEAYGTQGNNANCGNYPPAAGNIGNGEIIGQLAGTVMFLDHRLSLNEGNLLPSNYAPWLSGSNNYQFFNTIIPSATMTNVKWSQIGTLQAFQTAMQPYPNIIGDTVVCDEPSAATVTGSCNPACTTAHGTTPPTRCRYPVAYGPFCALATPVSPTNNCNTGAGGENFTDTWVVEQSQQLLSPLGNNGNPAVNLLPVSNTWLNGTGSLSGLPRQLWSYVSCASGGTCGNGTPGDTDFSYPSDNIDQRPVGNRAQEWFIFQSGETGELSFNATCMWTSVSSGGNCPSGQATTTDPWTSVYLFGNNGDGTIVYASTSLGTVHHVTQPSGSPLVTEIWIPSIRLKLKRDGLQDYEYLKALTTAGQGSTVTAQMNNWMTTLANYDSGTYTGAGLTAARTNIGNTLHSLSFAAPPWTGIIDPSRAINWSNAGVLDANGLGVGNGGAGIPSGTWTQSGTTINPYGPVGLVGGDNGFGNVSVTNGSPTVTWVSGSTFNTLWAGLDIILNNSKYVILSVQSSTSLTLSTNFAQATNANLSYRGGGGLDPSTIQTALNACGTNQYVLLGPGTFNLDGGLKIPSNCVLRGSGPNQTFINASYPIFGCANTANFICISSDGTSYGTVAAFPNGTQAATFAGASTTSTVTAGTYAQNGNFISVSGVGSSGIKVGQWIYLTEQDDLVDNGSYFNCQSLNVNPVCSFEGAAGAGMSPVAGTWYQQQQIVQVTSIPAACVTTNNTCTGAGPFTLGITPGIYGLHWVSGLAPYAWWPLSVTQNAGIENLAIDTLHLNPANVSGTVNIAFTNAVNSWVKGVQTTHGNLAHVWESPAAHITVQDSYFYSTINAASQSYGIEPFGPTGDSLAQNNICQQVVACFIEGPQMGSVYFGNFSIDAQITPPTILSQQTIEHDTAVMYNLYDHNIGQGFYSDPFHGTHGLNTAFRNRWTGHECTAGTCTTQGAWVVEDRAYNRMENFVGNVFGTTGFHGTASNCANVPSPCYENTAGQNAIFYTQAGGGETSNIVSISVDGGTGTAYTAIVGSAFPTTGGIGGNVTVAGVANTSYNNAPGAVYVVTSVSNNTPSGQATIHMTGPNQTLTASSGGTLGPIVPSDPLVTSTMLRWGNFDVVTNAVRWCASGHTGFATTCNSTSEVAPGLSSGINYFNAVPTLGDTGAAMPASLYYTSKPSWWPAGKPWPAIGPDVTGGNIGQCSGGSFPFNNATASSQCIGGTFTASDTAGHANSNPAMDCFLNVMGGPVDGSGPSLPFGGSGCPSTMAPTVTLLPATLAFGNQNINTTSAGLAVTLTNTSALNVVVTQAQVFGTSFTLTNAGTCFTTFGSNTSFTLPANQSCTWVITFSPTATIAYSGSFSVTDNASGSPQTISMSGQGTQATIVWSSPQGGTTYSYGSILINTPTNSANLTLQNTGTGPLNVALTITGTNAAQFSIFSSTCPNPLPAGNSCAVVVTFTSIAAASYTAFLTETDPLASNSPQNLTLNGTGVTSVPISAPWPVMVISQNRSPKHEISDSSCGTLAFLECVLGANTNTSSRSFVGSLPHYRGDGL